MSVLNMYKIAFSIINHFKIYVPLEALQRGALFCEFFDNGAYTRHKVRPDDDEANTSSCCSLLPKLRTDALRIW